LIVVILVVIAIAFVVASIIGWCDDICDRGELVFQVRILFSQLIDFVEQFGFRSRVGIPVGHFRYSLVHDLNVLALNVRVEVFIVEVIGRVVIAYHVAQKLNAFVLSHLSLVVRERLLRHASIVPRIETAFKDGKFDAILYGALFGALILHGFEGHPPGRAVPVPCVFQSPE
jgi:hypothetical protein